MAQLKDQQTGTSGDPFTVAGTFNATGGFQLDGAAGTSGQVIVSAGSGNTPTWGNAFIAGMIMLWSGSSATIPTGWLLCDGSSSTPDLRNRFVVGATSTYAVGATGGSADAIVVSHTHSISDPGHVHSYRTPQANVDTDRGNASSLFSLDTFGDYNTSSSSTGISINSAGSSGTNANLPPYYALCYIMKA
jgi:microcystin-dependent protein